jgi:pentatricopeptide repeat protein
MKEEKVEPGLIVYTCLIQSCIRAREIPSAIKLFDEMRSRKSIMPDAHIYSILSNGLLLNSFPDKALDLMLEAIETFGMHTNPKNAKSPTQASIFGASELCGNDTSIAKSLMRRL